MKKAFAMIVCLWTLFGLCGCGAEPPSETGKVSVEETETAQANEHETVYTVESVTHGTGGMADTIRDMTASLSDSAVILESIGISRSEVEGAQETVNGWLDGLGFAETAADAVQTGEKSMIMTVNGQDIEVLLYDTPAANSLYEMLPLELTFEDYNGVEKISYLPKPLTTDGESDSYDPDVGDFCLYAPWGNLSIFYQDFQNSSGLVSLGRIEEGMDAISAMEDDFVVTLSKTED